MTELRYLGQRALRALGVMVALAILTFVLGRALADPVNIILGVNATSAQRESLRHELGFDKPLFPGQFVDYFGGILHGDFGTSTWGGRPAMEMVLERLPASLLLAATAASIALLLGLTIGVLGGLRPGSWIDRVAGTVNAVSVAVPDFWLGIMLILLFSVELGWLPTSGFGGIEYVILPAITLSFRPAGRLARVAREAVIEELRKDYVVAARARGMRHRQVLAKHVFKNIAIASSTVLGYDFLFMFTGYAIGVEVVFNWPGVGRLGVEATLHEDVVLMSATVLITGFVVAVGNMLLDVLHAAIDRRVRS